MKKRLIQYLILVFFLILQVPEVRAAGMNDYDAWMKLKSKELLEKGEEYEKKESMDSALVLYTIITNRTCDTANKQEAELCCKAYTKKAILFFSYFFDYSKAYENILAAQELNNKSNAECIFVDVVTAVFYNIISVTADDADFGRNALRYCRKAYDLAYKKRDRNYMTTTFANMILISANLNDLSQLKEAWKTYRDDSDKSYFYEFNNLFYDHLILNEVKDYERSAEVAEKMLDLSSSKADIKRILMSYTSLINIYEMKNDPEKAFSYITKEEELVKKKKMREHEIELIFAKVKIYKMMNDIKRSDSCMHVYLIKKDSLLNMKQLNTLNRILYEGKSRKMESEMKEMSIKNQIYNNVIIIVLIFVVILLIMVFLLYVKIKQLKKSNITIYENNEQIIRHEEKERQKLKDEVSRLERDIAANDGEESAATEACDSEEAKYKNNNLSDDEKKKLLDKILTVMDDVDEICSESFSGARLAELTGSKYNYVSLVINENYGCNFNNFLNKFRIKEACRRLADDKTYGNYTIDTISNSLGFKSRTTLTTSFKKIVGLTPSQYREIAKRKHLE